jgi:hypothetical protein
MSRRHLALSIASGVLLACVEWTRWPTPIPEGGLSRAACDPSAGPFSATIENPYLAWPVGALQVLEGVEDGVPGRLEIRVLDETETVAGVETRVVEERHFESGELVELSRNYFVEVVGGTVCYFGEDVDVFEGGVLVGHPGAWRADGAEVQPGIAMPGSPGLGDFYSQEVAPGVALDRAEIVAVGEPVTVPAGTFTDTLRTREWTPLEPDVEEFKVYASGTGLLDDAGLLRQP